MGTETSCTITEGKIKKTYISTGGFHNRKLIEYFSDDFYNSMMTCSEEKTNIGGLKIGHVIKESSYSIRSVTDLLARVEACL